MNKRKQIRLKDYDYSQAGVYFITMCSKNRKQIFSNIVGDGDHIIRNEKDFIEHYTYIENNPIKWENDILYSKM